MRHKEKDYEVRSLLHMILREATSRQRSTMVSQRVRSRIQEVLIQRMGSWNNKCIHKPSLLILFPKPVDLTVLAFQAPRNLAFVSTRKQSCFSGCKQGKGGWETWRDETSVQHCGRQCRSALEKCLQLQLGYGDELGKGAHVQEVKGCDRGDVPGKRGQQQL